MELEESTYLILRFVPSSTGLSSKRCPGIGFLSRADRKIGVVRHVPPHTWLVSNFLLRPACEIKLCVLLFFSSPRGNMYIFYNCLLVTFSFLLGENLFFYSIFLLAHSKMLNSTLTNSVTITLKLINLFSVSKVTCVFYSLVNL